MSLNDLLRFFESLAWPIVALVAIFVIRPYLSTLLSGAKVKLTFSPGLSIETTLPEIKEIIEEQVGEALSPEEVDYLKNLFHKGTENYPNGVDTHKMRLFLRPLRNGGFIRTVPRNEFLGEAKAIEISGLGRLYLRALGIASQKET